MKSVFAGVAMALAAIGMAKSFTGAMLQKRNFRFLHNDDHSHNTYEYGFNPNQWFPTAVVPNSADPYGMYNSPGLLFGGSSLYKREVEKRGMGGMGYQFSQFKRPISTPIPTPVYDMY
jgi:hypothetical protein